MFSERAFFSFIELTDPDRHREYNEWHQLDHRPENLLLPGVAWGDRWARRRDRGAELGTAAGDSSIMNSSARTVLRHVVPTDYVMMPYLTQTISVKKKN